MAALQIGALCAARAGAAQEGPMVKAPWSEATPKAVLAREFFVAPDGKEANPGTFDKPWDLRSVLEGKHPFPEGGVVWMRGGTYAGDFTSSLKGAAGAPVILRQHPGERATVQGRLAISGGEHAWYWGFEMTHASPSRVAGGAGLDVYNAPHVKLVNLVIHDTNALGIGAWVGSVDAEIHGCVIYNNGYQGPARGHCHGIYTQNKDGTKRLSDNIIFNQFGWGIHAYTEKGFVEGYDVEGNICFNNGVIARGGRGTDNIIFVAGTNPMKRIRVRDNYTYHTPSKDAGASRLDWRGGGPHEDIEATGNYWIGGQVAVEVWNWNRVKFTGNTAYSEGGVVATLGVATNQKTSDYEWDGNSYYGSGRFRFNEKDATWDAWRGQTGLDGKGAFHAGRPQGTWVFVRANRYEAGRANVCIYNWGLQDVVDVDVSHVLKPGDRYAVRDVQDFFAEPVAGGVYQGGAIRIPMKGLKVATPKGDIPTPPRHTGPEFGAFVLSAAQP